MTVPDYVYEVETVIRNTGEKERAFSTMQFELCTVNNSIQINSELFKLVHPELDHKAIFIAPNSELRLCFP